MTTELSTHFIKEFSLIFFVMCTIIIKYNWENILWIKCKCVFYCQSIGKCSDRKFGAMMTNGGNYEQELNVIYFQEGIDSLKI